MVKALDLVGKKFGKLTVVSRSDSDKHGKTRWNCICDCGNDCIINGSCLKSGNTKSCGCLKSLDNRLEKYIDKSSGRWIWIGGKDKNGYGIIKYNNKTWKAHRLIYTLFVGKIPDRMCICHINDNPKDVTLSNLSCQTVQWNIQDKVNKGRQCIGEKNRGAKLIESDILEIRNSSLTCKKLSEIYGVNRSTISFIKTKKTWKHI